MKYPFNIDRTTWATLRGLLDAGMAQAPHAREMWLSCLPAEHQALVPQLRALLAHLEDADGDAPPLPTLPRIETPDSVVDAVRTDDAVVSDMIGPYRLVRVLGEGGMGSVWLAERSDSLVRRPVALKLPLLHAKHHALAERLARERDFLAALDHPNIARLYDAGVAADGRPFLALEYVEGEPIDRWCQSRQLDVPARLALFQQVAAAVAHAHTRLIVHRDLKPANILVTTEGQVRLLDFGIAKLLVGDSAPSTELTERAGRALTPAYASPEQVEGLPLGTSSDIYALGVVLYELLTGRRPYDPTHVSRAALEQAILHLDAAAPSTVVAEPSLRAALRGDLDTIVLKALKKRPDERYASANALADDLQRHLDHRPVLARPDSLAYQLSRLVRRHRLVFGLSAAMLVAVLAGAGAAAWQAHMASLERERADDVKDFVASILRDASPYEAGDVSGLSALDLVRQARKRLDASTALPAAVRAELAVLVSESLLTLGDVDSADNLLDRALADSRRDLGEDHTLHLRQALVMSQVDRLRGRSAQRQEAFARLLPLLRARAKQEPALLVVGLQHAAMYEVDRGHYAAAVAAADEGTRLARRTLGERHPETLASTLTLALSARFNGENERALAAAQAGWALTDQLYPAPQRHPRRVEARALLGRALCDTGHLREGVAALDEAVREGASLFGETSQPSAMLRQNVVAYRLELGQLERARADADAAAQVLLPSFAADSLPHARVRYVRGDTLLELRQFGAALDDLNAAWSTFASAQGAGHDATLAAQARLALALLGLGRLEDASRLLQTAEPLARAVGVSHTTRALLAIAQGQWQRLRGQPAAAPSALRPALEPAEATPRLQRLQALARLELGRAQLALGDRGAAMASLRQGRDGLAALLVEPTPALREADELLATATPR